MHRVEVVSIFDITTSSENEGMIEDLTDTLNSIDEGDIEGAVDENYWKELENKMRAMAGDGSRFRVKMKKNKLKVDIDPSTERNLVISEIVLKGAGL